MQVGRHIEISSKPLVAVIPDPRAARSLRFSPSERTVDGYHPSTIPHSPVSRYPYFQKFKTQDPSVETQWTMLWWQVHFRTRHCHASKTAFRSYCARPDGTLHTCVSEAFCPNFQPRAHARLTGLTTRATHLLLKFSTTIDFHTEQLNLYRTQEIATFAPRSNFVC